MIHQDEQLHRLRQRVARKQQLAAMLRELYARQRTLTEKVKELEAVKNSEQSDVDRLEGGSLAAFFYAVAGKKEERLTKEREEAYAARVKYDAAARELSGLEEEIERKERELSELQGCEERYQQALQDKLETLKRAGGADAEELLRLEERLNDLEHQKRELREAIAAGQSALDITHEVMDRLNKADNWATMDLFGGGLISDMAKYSHLDEAQAAVERLQIQLQSFRTELADVTIDANIQVNMDKFLRFADYFFDNLFTDWAVRDQINQTQDQIRNTEQQIRQVLEQLEQMSACVEAEWKQNRETLEKRVQETDANP